VNAKFNIKNRGFMRVGILGYGEIGQAIHKLYSNSCNNLNTQIFIKDLNRNDEFQNLDVLNVSIPYNDSFNFIDVVSTIAIESNAKMLIVHSTIQVGTIKKLKEILPNTKIAHSPCRGIHPNLYEGLLTFPKFVGATSMLDADEVAQHLHLINIKTFICKNSETTELAKLLDTSYYGICIAFHGEAFKICEKANADFEQAMTIYNTSYNDGYTKLGKQNVVRPVLTSPIDGIGGHCVVENAELLLKQFNSTALNLIVEYKKENK
jgi:UDP-N-acetyl-D-mannosaminuronate dehydrogenase